jgi:hypothetical protein
MNQRAFLRRCRLYDDTCALNCIECTFRKTLLRVTALTRWSGSSRRQSAEACPGGIALFAAQEAANGMDVGDEFQVFCVCPSTAGASDATEPRRPPVAL